MKIQITGDSGFVGRHLCTDLGSLGHEVYGLSQLAREMGRSSPRFGESIADLVKRVRPDLVVHAALKRFDPTGEDNVAGTLGWLRECAEAGVGRQVFISSISAEQSASAYGRSKVLLEAHCTKMGGDSLRLGLVMGDGGVFATMRRLIERFHTFPLLNGGQTPVSPLLVSHIAEAINTLILSSDPKKGRVYGLFEPGDLTMKSFLTMMAQALRVRYHGLPCPHWALALPVRLMERLLREKSPISYDNLQGLGIIKRPETESILGKWLPKRDPIEIQLEKALQIGSYSSIG